MRKTKQMQEALDYYIISMKFRRNFQLPADKQLKQLWAQVGLVLRSWHICRHIEARRIAGTMAEQA